MATDKTTIQVDEDVRKELEKLKISNFSDVIKILLKINDHCPLLSDEGVEKIMKDARKGEIKC